MIKPIKRIEHGLGIKRLMWIIVIIGIVLMPEDLLHLFAMVAHTLYESIAFALEEVLVHGAGLSKFEAQVIVFYTSFAMGILATIALIRRIPRMLASAKTRAIQSYIEVRADIVNRWHTLSTRRKLKLMLVQFVGIASMMALALA